MARSNNADSTGNAPQKTGRLRQIWGVYRLAAGYKRTTTWWMIAILVVATAIGAYLGTFWTSPWYLGILGFLCGLLGAMYLLARRAEAAAYSRIAGQPGAVGAALTTLRRGWTVEEQPVQMDPRTQDMVFRAVGRAGIALIAEGPHHRVGKLLDKEERRMNRLLPGVPVLRFEVGDDDGQIKLTKIASKVQRQSPKLSKHEAAEVLRRVRALGGVAMPIPKGVDPLRVRPDRKAMRGR